MDLKNLSDRELLLGIAHRVEQMEKDVNSLKNDSHSIKKDISVIREKQNDMSDTLYGDDERSIKGLVTKVKEITNSIIRYKKWEFAGITVVGFVTFIVSVTFGIKELYNMFWK